MAGDFFAHQFKWDAVQPMVFGPGSARRRFAVDDHKPPARFQRTKYSLQRLVVLAELVIGVNDQNRVEVVRQARVGAHAKDRFYLLKLFALLTLPHFIDRLFVNVYRIDLAVSTDARGQSKSEIAIAGAEGRHALFGLHPQRLHHFTRPLPLVTYAATVGFLRRIAGCRSARE